MKGVAWFTALESAEEVGIPVRRIATIEQKARGEGLVVAIHLESGQEIQVVESFERVRDLIGTARGDGTGDAPHTAPRPSAPLPPPALARRAP